MPFKFLNQFDSNFAKWSRSLSYLCNINIKQQGCFKPRALALQSQQKCALFPCILLFIALTLSFCCFLVSSYCSWLLRFYQEMSGFFFGGNQYQSIILHLSSSIIHYPSSIIIHRPSSIIHYPSSIIHYTSSITIIHQVDINIHLPTSLLCDCCRPWGIWRCPIGAGTMQTMFTPFMNDSFKDISKFWCSQFLLTRILLYPCYSGMLLRSLSHLFLNLWKTVEVLQNLLSFPTLLVLTLSIVNLTPIWYWL